MPDSPNLPNLDNVPSGYRGALDAVMPELMALDPARLLPMNLHLTDVATRVLGASSDIRELRPELVALCGEERARIVDRLDLVAVALLQANAAANCEPTLDLAPIAAKVANIRATFLLDVQALILRKLVDRGAIGELEGGTGHTALAFDALQLIAILRTHWDTVKDATPVTSEDLDRAEAAVSELMNAIGAKRMAGPSEATIVRRRAFHLCVHTYDQARRLVTYLRWDAGDADLIAPSLWSGRKTRRRSTGAEPARIEPPSVPVPPGFPGAPAFEPT